MAEEEVVLNNNNEEEVEEIQLEEVIGRTTVFNAKSEKGLVT